MFILKQRKKYFQKNSQLNIYLNRAKYSAQINKLIGCFIYVNEPTPQFKLLLDKTDILIYFTYIKFDKCQTLQKWDNLILKAEILFQTWQDKRNFNIWSTVYYNLVKCTLLPPQVKSVITNENQVVCRTKLPPNMSEQSTLTMFMEQTFNFIRAQNWSIFVSFRRKFPNSFQSNYENYNPQTAVICIVLPCEMLSVPATWQ